MGGPSSSELGVDGEGVSGEHDAGRFGAVIGPRDGGGTGECGGLRRKDRRCEGVCGVCVVTSGEIVGGGDYPAGWITEGNRPIGKVVRGGGIIVADQGNGGVKCCGTGEGLSR